ESVSVEGGGRNFAQGEVLTQFVDAWFHGCSTLVETPDCGRRQIEIRNPRPIQVSAAGEQRGLCILVLDEPASDNHAPGVGPAMCAVFGLRQLPTRIRTRVAQAGKASF